HALAHRSDRSLLLGEKFSDFWAVFGALLDDAFPARLVGFGPVRFGCSAIEFDGLNASIGLPFCIYRVLRVEFGGGFRFPALGRLAKPALLSIGQLVPRGLVDQDRDLGGVKSWIDAILRLLMPAEIEDPGDRPAISVDNPALKRCIDFARRSLHDRGA